MSIGDLDSAQALGCGRALLIAQAMETAGWSQWSRLWLVTRSAQPVEPEGAAVAIVQASLWGLGRVLALEHPEMWGGLIDLDLCIPNDEATMLLKDICAPDGEDQIA